MVLYCSFPLLPEWNSSLLEFNCSTISNYDLDKLCHSETENTSYLWITFIAKAWKMALFSQIYCKPSKSCRLDAKITRWTMSYAVQRLSLSCNCVWIATKVLSGLYDSSQLILKLHFHSKNYFLYSLLHVSLLIQSVFEGVFSANFPFLQQCCESSALPHKLVSSISDAVY